MSLGFDLNRLIARRKLVIDHVHIERSEIEENGEYDLEGIFIRLDFAIKAVGAKRVVLDTIETLFSGLSDQAILRAELRWLFGWRKERGLTTIITGERGEGQLTRQGLEEYVSDCVVLLDHRVHGQVSTRRLRVVKYRGSTHGTSEYPFLIDEQGISVMPLSSSGMDYAVSEERIPTGLAELDEMLGGVGYHRGSTVLLSGTAGTGKSSVAAHLADATCRRGERCLYFSFEEWPAQILRNMRSIGLNLGKHVRSGRLKFHSARPTVQGLEMHLVQMHKLIEAFAPTVVMVDPVSNLQSAGTLEDSSAMLIRLVDFLRKKGITAFLVSLSAGGRVTEATDEGISSMVDTWLLLRDLEHGGERNRAIYVLKSRGTAHSNQVREFLITGRGIRLVPVYLGPRGGLTGSARLSQEAQERAEQRRAQEALEGKRLALAHRPKLIETQIEALRTGFQTGEEEFNREQTWHDPDTRQNEVERAAMASSRRSSLAKKQEGK